uniref:Uncharacterized protein n=1 Tax=Tanacetum cinerariifolium TaxID=118510 RepID=A0A6L2JS12_TANCI|nr:hypothetical protein [Tanacetum cinerariifolium]
MMEENVHDLRKEMRETHESINNDLKGGEVVVWVVASGESGGGAVGRWQWCCMSVAVGCNGDDDNGDMEMVVRGEERVPVVGCRREGGGAWLVAPVGCGFNGGGVWRQWVVDLVDRDTRSHFGFAGKSRQKKVSDGDGGDGRRWPAGGRRRLPELWERDEGDADREVPINPTFHEQTNDEHTEKELKPIEANDQSI